MPTDDTTSEDGAPAPPSPDPPDADAASARRRVRLVRLLAGAALVILVALAVVAKVGVGTMLAIGEGMVRLAREGIRPAPGPKVVTDRPPPRPHDPLSDLPPDVQRDLLQPAPVTGQQFRYALALPPAAICRRMTAAGVPTSPYAQAAPGQWSCMSDLVPVPGSRLVMPDLETLPDGAVPEPARSTIFFTARGTDAGTLQVIRFKLNLDDPSVDRAGRALLIRLIDDLAGPLAWSAPPAVRRAIERHGRLALTDRGVTVQVHPETGPVRRLNVVLLLERTARQLPSDRFVAAPPLPAEMTDLPPGAAAVTPSPTAIAVPSPATSPAPVALPADLEGVPIGPPGLSPPGTRPGAG